MAYEFKLPDIGEGVVEGEIVRWLIQQGESIEEDQPLVEVMTDKATVELSSPHTGTVLERIGREGEIIEVGATLVVIEKDVPDNTQPPPNYPQVEKPKRESRISTPRPRKKEGASKTVLATPNVRKIAQEMQIDLSHVEGTGPGGRISQEDLERFMGSPHRTARTPLEDGLETESIPYRGLRRKIGEQLQYCKQTVPHYTYVEEVDATELVRLRAHLQETNKEENLGLSYLPFIMKATVEGLKQYPLLNSTLDQENELILLKKYYHIGIATATPEGLIVPVVKNVDEKDLLQIARNIADLSESARAGKVKLEDLKAGTFTITSLGSLGGILATPIINFPEVAILGVHKISPKPVVRQNEIVIREMMNLSVSLDHRVVDGAVAAEFLNHVVALLQNPESLG